MEITEKERLSREEAAARLHALADALARHNEVEFERGGLRFTVHVPDEVDFKLEIEILDHFQQSIWRGAAAGGTVVINHDPCRVTLI